MLQNYKPFIDRMINRYEGGYGWDRADPGGPTKYGITCWDLAEHRGQKMSSMVTWAPLVKAMPLSDAEEIYRTKYAAAVHFDDLPSGIDVVMLDYAVNSGPSRAIKVAAALVRMPGLSVMTPDLLKSLKAADPAWFISSMCAERLRFMKAIRGGSAWAKFGRGWQARVDDLRQYATFVSNNLGPAAKPAPDLTKTVTPKAINKAKTAGGPTAAGAGSAGVAAHAAGLHWQVVLGIVVAIVVVGIVYEAWQANKTEAANNKVHI